MLTERLFDYDELVKALRALLDCVEYLTDEGPAGEGWRSKDLQQAIDNASAVLSKREYAQ